MNPGRRLQVTYPANIHTHCPTQVFHFSDDGLLRRHDYATDVAGGVASHYCFRFTSISTGSCFSHTPDASFGEGTKFRISPGGRAC